MAFIATSNWPGCLPDTADDLPVFDTAREAWQDLADGLMEYDHWTEDGSLSPLALELEAKADMRMPDGSDYAFIGTVYGPDGYAYSVDYAEEDDDDRS